MDVALFSNISNSNISWTNWAQIQTIKKKAWRLTNELQNRKINMSNISELKKGDQELKTSSDIAEAFASHFTTIGEKLAHEIPKPEVHPLTYLEPTDSSFTYSLKQN